MRIIKCNNGFFYFRANLRIVIKHLFTKQNIFGEKEAFIDFPICAINFSNKKS